MQCLNCGKEIILCCQSEKDTDIFCGHCGQQLKEKCPECGKVEALGSSICSETRKELEKYIKKKTKKIEIFSSLFFPVGVRSVFFKVICLVVVAWGVRVCFASEIFEGFALFASVLILAFLGQKCEDILPKKVIAAKKRAKQEFLQNNPEKAEILRKAGIIKEEEG